MRDGIVTHMVVHYLSVTEAAERAHLSVNTVRSYIRQGLFPPHAVTVGRARGYDEAAIDRWIAERTPY